MLTLFGLCRIAGTLAIMCVFNVKYTVLQQCMSLFSLRLYVDGFIIWYSAAALLCFFVTVALTHGFIFPIYWIVSDTLMHEHLKHYDNEANIKTYLHIMTDVDQYQPYVTTWISNLRHLHMDPGIFLRKNSSGNQTHTSTIPVWCSTIWATKPPGARWRGVR